MRLDEDHFAPSAGARRDGSASVQSARGLLMTLLGEFVLPSGGSVWTQTLVEALGSLDVREKAARQSIARMQEGGWLSSERVGRQTRWSLTDRSRSVLAQGAQRIYGFGATRKWDGTWLVLLASLPETDRNLRYQMGNGLRWAGFGSLGQGTWISPWTDAEPQAVAVLEGLGVEATSFRGELGAMGTGAELAQRAWNLPELQQSYVEFLAQTASSPTLDLQTAATDLTLLVHSWRRFPFLDPGLPASLLPEDWPGIKATERFSELRAGLLPAAQEYWNQTQLRYS